MTETNCLPDNEFLTVEEGTLQLHVRHKCGTKHAYLIRFPVDSELGFAEQLNKDLAVLIDMMQQRAHHGVYEVNERKYYAIEQTDFDNAAMKALTDKMSVIVLKPRVMAVPVQPKEELKCKEPEPEVEVVVPPVPVSEDVDEKVEKVEELVKEEEEKPQVSVKRPYYKRR